MKKLVAVIILNWNGERLLKEFLASVVANTSAEIADVIVADNGSTDESVEWIERTHPEVQIIKFADNHGYAGGYNRAIEITRYKYTVLLNSDVMTPEGWLEPLYNWASKHPDTGAAMPKILSYASPEKFEYAGASGGFIDRNGYPYCRGRIFSTVETDHGQYDDAREVFWATGAAMLVDTEAYLAAGGLDERFFAHMEEIDLCWRLLTAGRKNYVVPESRVYHLGGGSLPAGNPKKTYLNFRNNLLMLHKNLPDSTRKRKLLKRRLLDTLAWGMFIVKLDFANAGAVLRAHRDFRQMRRNYTLHPANDLLDTRDDTKRNILTDYYIKRKRYFSTAAKKDSTKR